MLGLQGNFRNFFRVLSMMMLVLAPVPAYALATDSLIEGAKLCTRHLPRFERQYGIPVHLLSAIASTESGRYHKGLKISVPWPWTINAEGKGYIFNSKHEAITAVKRLRSQGVKSIDVGCMQVNLHHHAHAFASLDAAFDPETNIAYAAGFLRSLYDEQNNWKKAASSYHSRTSYYGTKYVGKVYDSWYNIINRVRNAKQITNVKGTTLAAASGTQGLASTAQLASASAAAAFASSTNTQVTAPERAPVAKATTQASVTPQAYTTPSMKVIKVKTVTEQPRQQETLVIHPQAPIQAEPPLVTAPAPVAAAQIAAPKALMLADAQTSQPTMIKPMAAEMTIYPQDRGDIVSGHRSGPRFIFNE